MCCVCLWPCRDCTTGELKTVTDPTQRCTVRTVCPAANLVNTTTPATKRNAGTAASPSSLLKLLSALLAVAAAVLML